jgi:hypothetical protein
MNEFEQVCRPVIFEHNDEHICYWGKGSSFLISNPENYYWVTASHVLKNTDGCVESVRIFPSDNSQISLPFDGKYTVKADSTNEEDYQDILILRINLQRFDDSGDAPLSAQDLEQGILGAEHLREGDELWIIGYPSERTFFDYDNRAIEHTRCVIRAIYSGESSSEHHCHTLTIDTSLKLGSFDGLSGSPVFYMKSINRNGQLVDYPLLVGMLLRGTPSSGIAHFVSVSVITEMVSLIESKIHHSVINRKLKL